MLFDDTDTKQVYLVLINDEEQFSVWPAWKDVPSGWRSVSQGNLKDCTKFIDETWRDMRPKSLREAMNGNKG
jgi:MbtH protein